MRKLKHILPDAMDDQSMGQRAEAMRILRQWPEVVGPILAERSFPDGYRDGIVWVAVTGSSWAQELRMHRTRILSRLSELAGDSKLFTGIKFGVRPLKETFAVVSLPEDAPKSAREELKGLSIREIAERRLKKMQDERAT